MDWEMISAEVLQHVLEHVEKSVAPVEGSPHPHTDAIESAGVVASMSVVRTDLGLSAGLCSANEPQRYMLRRHGFISNPIITSSCCFRPRQSQKCSRNHCGCGCDDLNTVTSEESSTAVIQYHTGRIHVPRDESFSQSRHSSPFRDAMASDSPSLSPIVRVPRIQQQQQ